MFGQWWSYRGLLFELTKRQFSGRYQGSFGGIFWSFLQPLFLLSVYTLAFGVILKARWGFAGNTTHYALMLFSGLIIFNATSEVITLSPSLITDHPNFVKKIVFPLELLPVVGVLTALMHAGIALLVWLLGYGVLFGWPSWHILGVLFIVIAFSPVLLGIAWLLAAVGVVLRDIHQVTSLINHSLLFLTPIFYSIEAAPPLIRKCLLLNPLTFIVEQFRLILFYGQIPALKGLLIYALMSSVFAMLSLSVFRRLRAGFADWI